MNSYQVRSTNPLYNDVIAYITAESKKRAIELAEDNYFIFDDDMEIILERTNVVDQLGKPYPESITFY
jgi:NACalpha-BTF3-like transcription factor